MTAPSHARPRRRAPRHAPAPPGPPGPPTATEAGPAPGVAAGWPPASAGRAPGRSRSRVLPGAVPAAGLAAVLAALGGTAFASAFSAADLIRPVAIGAVGGAAVSLAVTGVARRRLAASALAAVTVLVPLAMAAGGGGPSEVLTGLRDGAHVILTSAVPTPAESPVLVVPFALTAAAAFLGAERAQRTRSPAAPVLPSLVTLIGALAFGFEGSRPDGRVAAAWVAAAGLAVALRRQGGAAGAAGRAEAASPAGAAGAGTPVPATGVAGGQGTAGRARTRALAVIPVVLVVAAVGHAVGPRLPGAGQRERFTLRDWVDQPAPPRPLANPFVLMAGLHEGPDDVVFVVESSEPVDRWRLAALDSYDGQEWFSDVSFVPAGNRLPEPSHDGESGGTTVTQRIEPVGLEGQWLPVAEGPVEISVDDVFFDVEGGVLLSGTGDLPESYEVTSILPEPDAAALPGAGVARDEEAVRTLELPSGVPEDVSVLAEEITAGATSAYMRATAIERFLAQSDAEVPFRLATEQPPTGHSFGHLRCFLLDVERCGHQGSVEQFVAAYALLARSAGLPTRIAVGFGSSGSSGRDEVTAHEAMAWAEVKFEGVGWVPFNPVPNPDVATTPPPADVAGGGGTPDDETSTTVAPPDEQVGDDGATGDDEDAGGGRPLPWLVAGAVALVALLAAPAATRARRRRRRQRAASPGERIAGAWAEAVDHLARSGVRTPPTVPVRDVVLEGRVRLDGVAEPLVPLGELVNRSQFARGEPAEADATAAWQFSDAFADRRRRSRSVPQRAREYFAVRSAANRLVRREPTAARSGG